MMNYFNGIPFISFLILAVLLAVRIFILRKKGVHVSPKKRESQRSTKFLYPVFGFILLTWLFEIIKPAFQISLTLLPEILTNRLFESVFLKIAGAILLLLSLIFFAVTLMHFNTSLRFGLDKNNQGKLITTGIFSFSRNPFFLSLDLYFTGVALFFPSPFFIGFTVLAIVSIHFFILKEERFLRKVYGGEYEHYTEKVRRYF